MIRLDDIRVSAGDVEILRGIELNVSDGEFVGLVGPNGSGKTTILQTINGITEPHSGAVWISGDRAENLTAKERGRRVATVPQDTHVGFSFTAEQIVEMGRTPYRSRLDWTDGDDTVNAALERTGTTELRDRKVDNLSGGERQRILLARAVAQDPGTFVLDEPTANLDINHQVRMLELVRSLAADGRAAIAAIHDLELAGRYCDRLLLVEDGTIQARGSPQAVLNNDRLAQTFGTETAVTRNPVTGTPAVTAIADRPERAVSVHVAGSGPSAAAAIAALWRAGFEVTAGIAPLGDVASVLCRRLDIDVVTVAAFEAPAQSRRQKATELARQADVVVHTGGREFDVAHVDDVSGPVIDTNLSGTVTGATSVDGGASAGITEASELVEQVHSVAGEGVPSPPESGE